jgi:CubicO group peptidase (beta-lactamase class C family)
VRRSARRPPAAHGDHWLAPQLARLSQPRTRDVAVALVDLDAVPRVRTAFLGRAELDTRFEIGSVTKGLTGMLVAAAVARGELSGHTRVAEVLPVYGGTEFGTLTVRELCSHTSGLPRLGGGVPFLARALPFALLGLDPYRDLSARRLLAQASRAPVGRRGTYRYSNLGAAVVGALLAAVAQSDYATLLEERVLSPLGMADSGVSRRGFRAHWGHAGSGLRRQPWTCGAYAPAGGVLSTVGDMAKLVTALLDGSAPGQQALTALADVQTESANEDSGLFWVIARRTRMGVPLIWHNGATGGYSAFVALFPELRLGVVALANVDASSECQDIALAVARFARPTAGATAPAVNGAVVD